MVIKDNYSKEHYKRILVLSKKEYKKWRKDNPDYPQEDIYKNYDYKGHCTYSIYKWDD